MPRRDKLSLDNARGGRIEGGVNQSTECYLYPCVIWLSQWSIWRWLRVQGDKGMDTGLLRGVVKGNERGLGILTSRRPGCSLEPMSNLLLTGVLLTNILLLCAIAAAWVRIRAVSREIVTNFTQFVSAPDEKTPSPLAQFTESVAHVIGHAAAVEIKTTIMGKNSGDARLEAAVEGQLAEAAAGKQNPLLAGLLGMLDRKTKSKVLKNPGLMEFLIEKVSSGAFSGKPSPGGNGHSEPVRFKLG